MSDLPSQREADLPPEAGVFDSCARWKRRNIALTIYVICAAFDLERDVATPTWRFGGPLTALWGAHGVVAR